MSSLRALSALLAAPALLGLISLTACGSDGQKASAPGTVAFSTSSTSTPTSPSTPAAAPVQASTTTVTAPAPVTHTVTATATTSAARAAAPGTRCYTKYDENNGHERYAVFATKNVSCEFATNVGIAAMNTSTSSDSYAIQAYSPATGQTYTMNCTFVSGDTGVECTGANNAIVEVGLNTGF